MTDTGENIVDDDVIRLPDDTLAVLQQFLKEKQEREEREQEVILTGGKEVDFEENWQLSQFWYSDKTKQDLTTMCKKLAEKNQNIALLSSPSLYKSFKDTFSKVTLFEFDKRFSSYGEDFVFYDFNEGEDEEYLSEFKNSFDILIVDPPFLSEECIRKMSCIVRRLASERSKIIFCSGEVVEQWITKYLKLKKCNYQPQHERNLGNEFVSYANFNLDEYL